MNFRNTKFKKIILTAILLTIVLCIVVTPYLLWIKWIKPSMLWSVTYRGHMLEIGSAISLYEGKFGRLPTSLEEMVSAGFLPEKSNMYSCPMKHGTRSGKVLPYTECEYVITFDPNKIVIYIPKEIFDNKLYRNVRIKEDYRKREFLKEYKKLR